MLPSEKHNEARPTVRRFRYRGIVGLVFLFAMIFGVVYWATDIQPYASLGPGSEADFIHFSPDSRLLLTRNEKCGPMRLWDLEKGVELFSLPGDWAERLPISFSPDSELLAAQETSGKLTIWRTNTAEEVTSFRPTPWPTDFRFDPTGRFIVY